MKTGCRILGWNIWRREKNFGRPGLEIFILKAINREEGSDVKKCNEPFGAGIFVLNFSTPVYKMWITQEPNTLELWNKLQFEKESTESIYHV